MTRLVALLGTLVLAGAAAAAPPPDAEHGQSLHARNCIDCHANMTGGDGSLLYTRASRRIDSPAALEARVRYCQSSLGLDWSDRNVADVAAYLDRRYYKFDADDRD